MKPLEKWARQPTTMAGIASILSALGQWAAGAATWQVTLPLVIVGAVGLAWPNMPAAEKGEITQLVNDAVRVAVPAKAASDAPLPVARPIVKPSGS